MLLKRWKIGRQPHPRNTRGRVSAIGVEHFRKLDQTMRKRVQAR